MEQESRRLFIGGLYPEISADDLKSRFKSFGVIKDVDIKIRKDAEGNPTKTFAYLDAEMTEKDLKKCVQTYNKTKWKGHVLQIQTAKESFLQKLKKEHMVKDTPPETPVKKSEEPEENKHHVMKDLVVKGPPGTAVEGKEGWVAGKYGRAVPVVKMRGKDQRKILTLDPSKVTHQIKVMDRGKVQVKDDVALTELTWELQENDSEISKKRKGEFPKFTPKKKKVTKIVQTPENVLKPKTPKSNGTRKEMSEFEVVSIYKSRNKSQLSAKAMDYDSDSSAGSADTDEIIASRKPTAKEHQEKEKELNENSSSKSKLSKDNKRKSSSVSESDNSITPKQKRKQSNAKDNSRQQISAQKDSPVATPSSGKVYHSDSESEDEKPMFTVLPNTKFTKAQPFLAGNSKVSEFDSGIVDSEIQNGDGFSSGEDEEDILDQIAGGQANVVEMKAQKDIKQDKKGKAAEKSKSITDKKKITKISTPSNSNDETKSSDSLTSEEESADDMDDKELKEPSEKSSFSEKSSSSHSEEESSSSDEGNSEENIDNNATVASLNKTAESSEESSSSSEESSDEATSSMKTVLKPVTPKTKPTNIIKKETVDSSESSSSSEEESSSESSDKQLNASVKKKATSNTSLGQTEKVTENNTSGSPSSSESSDESSDDSSDSASKKPAVPPQKRDVQTNNVKNTSLVGKTEAKTKDKETTKSKTLTPKEKVKKQELDNKKRLESLKQRKEDAKSQQTLIKKALSVVDADTKSGNKKILFDSESDSSSESENEEAPKTKKTKVKKIGKADKVNKETKENKPSLFDSSDEDDEESDEEKDQERFQIRPEFEGKAGRKLMSMQGRFGNDQRFKMDQRFLEENSSEEEEEMEIEPIKEVVTETSERDKAMQILTSVVGTKKMSAATQKEAKKFKDISTLRYDPTTEGGQKFEIKTPDDGVKEKKKKKKKKGDKEEVEMEAVPEVSKERFFEVNEPLKGVFEKKENESFSFLSMFGRGDEEEKSKKGNDDLKMEVINKKMGFSWQEQFSDESSEDDDEKSSVAKLKDSQKEDISKIVVGKDSFFFVENDARIKEGVNFFHRTEDLDKIRESWLEKRPSLIEAYKNKRKRVLRRLKHQKGGKHVVGLKKGKPVRGR